jgi:hypothetical protein
MCLHHHRILSRIRVWMPKLRICGKDIETDTLGTLTPVLSAGLFLTTSGQRRVSSALIWDSAMITVDKMQRA